MLCPLPSTAFWGYRNDFWGMEVISAERRFSRYQISIKRGRNSLFPGRQWGQLNYILWICLQSVKTVLWRLHDCSPREVLTYTFSPGPFQQAANAYMQLEPNTWCAHATSDSFDCIILSLSRGRILARGCLFHLHVAMLYVLSSRVEFFSVTLKFLLFCLGADESGRGNGPEMDIQPSSKAMWTSSLLEWGHLSWELHCMY